MTRTTIPQRVDETFSSNTALWLGILVSLLFTALVWFLKPLIPQVDFLPDTGASWYYWKLPEPTILSRATAWIGYLLHQITMWALIYYGQSRRLKYTPNLHRLNLVALAANGFFIALHFVQTYLWYDGLAQDVSIWSSQGSVILLLVLVLLMENQRRGLFWGQKVKFLSEPARVARKYHGYIFAWGIIYTFWYHPMEATSGHLVGFLYTFLLMLQGSLMFTRAHLNRWWTFALEATVLVHGTLVAVMNGNGMWPMFFFGFAGLFIVTQMHGLGLKKWVRWGFVGAYALAAVLVYSQAGWSRIHELTWIPLIEYLAVFVAALIIWLGVLLVDGITHLWSGARAA